MSRQDQYQVMVVLELDGTRLDTGIWDTMSGGEVDSEETKYRPGGMGDEITLGGMRSVGNVTVSRLYDLSRDHSRIGTLLRWAGKANATVSKQPLTVNKVAFGKPIVYTGKLKAVTPPEHDSNSNDAGMLEMEISSAQVSAAG